MNFVSVVVVVIIHVSRTAPITNDLNVGIEYKRGDDYTYENTHLNIMHPEPRYVMNTGRTGFKTWENGESTMTLEANDPLVQCTMTARNQPEIRALRVDNWHVLTFLDEVCALTSVLVHLPFRCILPAFSFHGIALTLLGPVAIAVHSFPSPGTCPFQSLLTGMCN